MAHENAYLAHLEARGVSVLNLRDIDDSERALARTREATESGVEAISQATLANGRWFGRADVLQRVERASKLGSWSYEVYDCKLACDTKAATILQLMEAENIRTNVDKRVLRGAWSSPKLRNEGIE